MVSADEARTLRWVEGFRELSPDDVRRVSALCRWKWYQPQQLIFSQSDAANDMFFVVQGKVRITSYSTVGKEVSFRDLTVGECFGDLAAIDGRPRSAAAVAISDALLASMPAQAYWQTLMTYPPVAGACLRRLANLVRALSERVIEYSLLPVPTRIKLEILRLAERQTTGSNSAEIEPAPTHMEIASRVATHREAVTRELRQLAKTAIIVQEGRKLIIKDMAALRASVGALEASEPPAS